MAMRVIRSIFRVIDSISNYLTMGGRWLVPALVLIIFFEVIMRWGFRMPTIWVFEMAPMMGVAIIVLGWSNVQRLNRHIRVDIFYHRYSPRAKAITDAILTTLLFFPLFIAISYETGLWAWSAFTAGEIMLETPWRPLSFPIKTIYFLGASWLVIQAIVTCTRDWYFIFRGKQLD